MYGRTLSSQLLEVSNKSSSLLHNWALAGAVTATGSAALVHALQCPGPLQQQVGTVCGLVVQGRMLVGVMDQSDTITMVMLGHHN